MNKVPIMVTEGIELVPTENGVCRVRVIDHEAWRDLSWDRYVRLKAVADAIQNTGAKTVLDAGGYDGALGLLLPNVDVDVIDPATTGGSIFEMNAADRSYDAVVAIDLLEHVEPMSRARALSEFARISRSHVILNYPCQSSEQAQKLLLKLTGNQLIKEHVQWELPDSDWVANELRQHGFRVEISAHTNIAIWLGQYLALNLIPDVAKELNRHLVEHHSQEPFSNPLYHLVSCHRSE